MRLKVTVLSGCSPNLYISQDSSMEALLELGVFGAKALILFAAFAGVIAVIAAAIQSEGGSRDSLEVRDLNARYRKLAAAIRGTVLSRKESKKFEKRQKKLDKTREDEPQVLYVLDFDGDVSASSVEGLREEVSGILQIAEEGDEVLIRIESAGGTVTGYGLAAAQLRRLRDAGIAVTAAVDTVAASGGYMMACTADTIVAAPFAIVGSIGVLAIVPNASRALDKVGVDVHEFTAGRHKRTVTPFSEVTPEGREKFLEELSETHDLFKAFVKENRPVLDIDAVATGEHWHASQALTFGMVDAITTSDDYLLSRLNDRRIISVNYMPALSFSDRLPIGLAQAAELVWQRVSTRESRRRLMS